MRSALRTALLAALPLEAVNFWVVGYPTAGGSLTTVSQNALVASQWDLLHFPALVAIDRILLLRQHAHACSLVFLLAGYIDTAIVAAVVLYAIRLAGRPLRKLSSPMKHAH